jgi:Tfp pilus assembly PilM family ATPase/Tfp pilus assembly protein PilN
MIFSYRSLVGIEYSEKELRFVELLRGFRGVRVGGYGVVSLSSTDQGVSSKRRDVLVNAIRELISTGKIRSRRAIIGVSRSSYFFRKITFPPVASEKLKPIIENQVERAFPVRSDQLVYDYQEIGKGKNGGKEVILAGVRNSKVDEIIAVSKAAGLELLRIDMKEIAICNLLKLKDSQLSEPFVLLNIDKEATYVDLLVSGHPVICRKIELDSQKIQLEKVFGEVEKSIGFYSELSKEESGIKRIVLSGDSSLVNPILPELIRFFRLEVEKLSAGDLDLNLPDDFDIGKLGHSLGLALSGYQVAVHSMDLLPRRVKEKRKKDEWIRMGVASLGIIFLASAFSIASAWRNEAKLEEIEREIAAIEGRVNSARELKKEYEGLVNRSKTLNKLQVEKPHWLAILNNLSVAIPEDAWLTVLDMEQGESLKLSGNASSSATLIPLLESSPYLKNVKFEAPTTTRDFGGEEVESFRITANVDWSGESHAEETE